METENSKHGTRSISGPESLWMEAEKRASSLGLKFSDYIQILTRNDLLKGGSLEVIHLPKKKD